MTKGFAPGQLIGGRYALRRRLGAGGMGELWAAEQQDLGRLVAIKFMAASLASDAALRERFDREARAAAMLRTRHVVAVTDHGVDSDVPFLVMDLLEGEDLHARLQRVGRLTIADTRRIARQVGRALSAVHGAGIVHRDLKPANTFLARIDGEEVVKLVDFHRQDRPRDSQLEPPHRLRDHHGIAALHESGAGAQRPTRRRSQRLVGVWRDALSLPHR